MKASIKSLLLFIFISYTFPSFAQIVDVESQTDGILIPRMTQAQRDLIDPNIEGMLIYQTNSDPGFYYFNGSAWQALGANGNSGSPSSDIITGRIFGNFNSGRRYTIGTAACTDIQELFCSMIMPRSGTLKNMYVLPSGSTPSGGSAVFSLRLNGDNQSLAVTIPDGSDNVGSDLVNSVSVSAGDRITIQMLAGSASSGINYFISMLFE